MVTLYPFSGTTYSNFIGRYGYGIIKSENDPTLIASFAENNGVINLWTNYLDSPEYGIMGISNETWVADPFITFACTQRYGSTTLLMPHKLIIEFNYWGVEANKITVTNATWWKGDYDMNKTVEYMNNSIAITFSETFQSVQSPGTLKLGDLVFDLNGVTQEEQFQWLI